MEGTPPWERENICPPTGTPTATDLSRWFSGTLPRWDMEVGGLSSPSGAIENNERRWASDDLEVETFENISGFCSAHYEFFRCLGFDGRSSQHANTPKFRPWFDLASWRLLARVFGARHMFCMEKMRGGNRKNKTGLASWNLKNCWELATKTKHEQPCRYFLTPFGTIELEWEMFFVYV